jgi:hypothetical protein
MTSAAPGPGFLLAYELRREDLQELYAAEPIRRRRRVRIVTAVPWALIGAAFTAVTIALDLPSVRDSPGAPGWMYVIDCARCGGLVAYLARIIWRLNPKRLARRAWRAHAAIHGRHRDEVGPDGVRCTAPDGTQMFILLGHHRPHRRDEARVSPDRPPGRRPECPAQAGPAQPGPHPDAA